MRKLFGNKVLKDIVNVTGLTIIGKTGTFILPFFIAYQFGVTGKTDTFFFAYSILLFFSSIFSSGIESVIVPFIAEIREKSIKSVGGYIGTLLITTGTISFILLPIIWFTSTLLLPRITGFSSSDTDLILDLIKEMFPLIPLLIWGSVLRGTLNAYQRYSIPALSPIFKAGITILFIFFFTKHYGIYSIVWGYIMGEAVQFVILATYVNKTFFLELKLNIERAQKAFNFFKVLSFQLVSVAAVALNSLVTRAIASWLEEGNVTLYEYADRLFQVPTTLIIYGLFVVILSHWSKEYYQGNIEIFRKSVLKTVIMIGLITALISFVLFMYRYQITDFIYNHGEFPSGKLALLGNTFGYLALGFMPYMIELIFINGYLVLKQTRILMYIAIVTSTINIILSLLLVQSFGIAGIALSITLTHVIGAFLEFALFVNINKTTTKLSSVNKKTV